MTDHHRRRKRGRKKKDLSRNNFQTLVSGIRSLKNLDVSILKSLYLLLSHLTSNETVEWCSSGGDILDFFNLEVKLDGLELKFKDVRDLSDIVFRQLHGRLKFSDAFRDVSTDKENGQHRISHSDMWVFFEELILTLRCCFVILILLECDQNLLIVRSQILLLVLRRLVSSVHADNGGSLFLSDPVYKCALLQVFADELLIRNKLRDYFMIIDSASPASERLFIHHFVPGDIGCVPEVIAAHFITSVSDEQVLELIPDNLLWPHEKDFWVFELSFTGSLLLLQNPILSCAPKVLQAYLILLVSKAVGISICFEAIKPDVRMTDCYLTTLERSINLYTTHTSALQLDCRHPNGGDKSYMRGSRHQVFESYFLPATSSQIHRLVTKLHDSWDTYKNSMPIRKKSDIVEVSIAYVKDSLVVFDDSYRDQTYAILKAIVHKASSDDMCNIVSYDKESISLQDFHLLASIMKLMSTSLLQTVCCLKCCSSTFSVKTLKDVWLQKEFDKLLRLISCFKQWSIHQPMENFMLDMTRTHPKRHEESKWMLLHFSGLLSISYVNGLDFLAKECICIIVSLLHLFVFEEGDLDSFSSLVMSGSTVSPAQVSDYNVEDSGSRKSSAKIAKKFQKIQTLFLSSDKGDNHEQIENPENASVSNGKTFLNYILKGPHKSSDIEDLADFIVCDQRKDYSVWIKDRWNFLRSVKMKDRQKSHLQRSRRLAAVNGWEKQKQRRKIQ